MSTENALFSEKGALSIPLSAARPALPPYDSSRTKIPLSASPSTAKNTRFLEKSCAKTLLMPHGCISSAKIPQIFADFRRLSGENHPGERMRHGGVPLWHPRLSPPQAGFNQCTAFCERKKASWRKATRPSSSPTAIPNANTSPDAIQKVSQGGAGKPFQRRSPHIPILPPFCSRQRHASPLVQLHSERRNGEKPSS